MRKKVLFYSLLAILLLISLSTHIYKKHIMVFSYINPHTNTQCFRHIAKTINLLDKAFDSARISLNKENIKIKYLYENAYGSGFIKNNPIPNDLDYAIGIDLGEFEYTGSNKIEVANKLVEAMNAYQLSLVFYINNLSKDIIVSKESPIDYLNELTRTSKINKASIAKSLDKALENKSYILHTKKDIKGNYSEDGVEIPFIMEPGEILLEDRHLLKFFSNQVCYSDTTPKYMREISIIPEYFATIKHNNKKYKVFFAIEASLGGRIQLARRLYVPQTFVHLNSRSFFKNSNLINNDDMYVFYRFFSFKSHLQEINKQDLLTNKPIKVLKRLLQIANTIYPLLKEEELKEIYNFTNCNLNNNSIILLNNYLNICSNLKEFTSRPELYFSLLYTGEIKRMLDFLDKYLLDLSKDNGINKNDLKVLSDFYNQKAKKLLEIESKDDLENIKNIIFDDSYTLALNTTNTLIKKTQSYIPDKISTYNSLFNQILTNAGYHKITLYWLNNDTIGILKDDFTKDIKDLSVFTQKNELVDVNYKLIQKQDIPSIAMRYDVFVKYNSTSKEQNNFDNLITKLLDDKKNFKVKTKVVFY